MSVLFFVPFVLFFVIFAAAAFAIFRGFRRTSRLHGKIFDLAERQIDRQLEQAKTGPRRCEYCDATVVSGAKCDNCGAPV